MSNMDKLIASVKVENEKTRAWIAEDPENRFAGLRPEDPHFYHNRGIHTLEDLEKSDLMSYISDGFKDLNGIRPKWLNLAEMSLEELKSEADKITNGFKLQEAFNKVKEERNECIILDLCHEHNCTREDLERWEVI